MFLKFSQDSQENTCVGVSFLIKAQAPATLLKKDSEIGIFLWILQNFQGYWLGRSAFLYNGFGHLGSWDIKSNLYKRLLKFSKQ